jgi:hypothetical protein
MTHDRKIYLIVGGVLLVLLVVMFVTYRSNKSDESAQQKAQALTAALKTAGLPVPADTQRVVDLLGDDGGSICGMTGSDLAQSIAKTNMSVGGGFYQRPVLVAKQRLDVYVIVVSIYCPEKLADAKAFADSLRYGG